MAAPAHKHEHIPGIEGGDLPEREQFAFEEGHDADLRPNEGAGRLGRDSMHRETTLDTEKGEKHDSSSNASEAGDRDVEKAQGIQSAAEVAEEPVDPNIVDWEGPDDPANPQNWTGKKRLAQGHFRDRVYCHYHVRRSGPIEAELHLRDTANTVITSIAGKKWSNIGILSFLTLLTPLASSMFAPGVPDVIAEFHTDKYVCKECLKR
jgi:hypothetical protein